ncbi:helix-turn-helix domain-containing protein [Nocardiopsis synnemataformans]|uniref:helix-turn-helix domain-containing protein n=1 Tax=Nocardiopsis synnemataformans TaxID=61305 RepID=UPI003EC10A5F
MLTGFRYRLALTDEQAQACQTYGDICRAVWNTGLDQRREAVSRYRESQSVFHCGRCGHRAHADVNAAQNTLMRGWTNPSG